MSHCFKKQSLRRSKFFELPELCLEWVPSNDEPEQSDMLEDGKETEDKKEGDDNDNDDADRSELA